MGLIQIKPAERINFLKRFTFELVLNTKRETETFQKIATEKIRQKFINKPHPEEILRRLMSSEVFKPSINSTNQTSITKPIQPILISPQITPRTMPIIKQLTNPIQKQQINIQNQALKQLIKPITNIEKPIDHEIVSSIQPEPKPRPQGFVLGKLEPFLKDQGIQSIECSGPGKNILIKNYRGIGTTKVTLTQQEITDIINNFAKEARIPLIGGILKAVVGNLVISAVSSDFVGSRFIITKKSIMNITY
jgi:hypothetical protein